jgi:ATP-dependent Clp protease adapter protein ClpS
MVKTFSRPLSQQQNPNRLEPTRKPQLDLLEKDEVKSKRPSMWNIVFYNDDYTPIDFVVFVVTKIFHRSTEDALALTLAVHTQGKGIAGTYTFEGNCSPLITVGRGSGCRRGRCGGRGEPNVRAAALLQ